MNRKLENEFLAAMEKATGNIPWYKDLILTHEIDPRGRVMPIKNTAGNPRFDLQWELERWQNGQARTDCTWTDAVDVYRRLGRIEFWQAVWGLLMIVISTASLTILLYAVLE